MPPRISFRPLVTAVAAVLLGLCVPAFAAVTITDDFEEASHPGSSLTAVGSTSGIAFYQPNYTGPGVPSPGTVTIDSGGITGRSLRITDTDGGSTFNTSAVGLLPGTASLANVNDTLSATFTFRITTTSGEPLFRFGFYNSNGSAITGSDPGAVNDNGFYFSLLAAGSAAGSLFYQENGGTSPILGGTDRSTITASGPSGAYTTGAGTSHTVTYTLTRTSTTTIGVSLVVDGGSAITGSQTTSNPLLFDEIAIGSNFNTTNQNMFIDNLSITASTFTTVPEPSRMILLALGAVSLVWRRKR